MIIVESYTRSKQTDRNHRGGTAIVLIARIPTHGAIVCREQIRIASHTPAQIAAKVLKFATTWQGKKITTPATVERCPLALL